MRGTSKKNSIATQLLCLTALAAVAAIIIFTVLDYAGEYLVDNYLEKSDYTQKKDQKYVDEFQQYVTKKNLSTEDAQELDAWVEKQQILFVWIYKDGVCVFDSEYPQQGTWDDRNVQENYERENHYTVEFEDGSAEVLITGLYMYQFLNYLWMGEIIFSFAVFLFLVFLGIRRKIVYIRKLSEEIEILEGGSLDYPITISGQDELSALAEGLDSMRLSLRNLIRREAEMVRENQRIVTEMSHDLRTPITSLILYTEIVKKRKYKNDAQFQEYLDKIDEKAHRMKLLTDHLFEYSLIAGEGEVELEEPEQYGMLFYDLLSETVGYLEQKGFQITLSVDWTDCMIKISTDYVTRIFDNITSNIVKYADPSVPVEISSAEEKQMIGFVFANKILLQEEKPESTEIGLQNVKNMMQKMGGKCMVKEEGERFCITLLFPMF